MIRLYERAAELEAWFASWLPEGVGRVVHAVHAGLWLGLLSEARVEEIGRRYHLRRAAFRDEAHNRRGLYPAEKAFVTGYLGGRRTVLVGAVGGGRELLALRRAGFDARGFDCAADLVDEANALMRAEGHAADVTLAPRDRCPPGDGAYEAAIFGWNATMMVRGRERRVRLFRELRSRLVPGAPLLLTFWTRSPRSLASQLTAGLSRALGRVTRAAPVETGDDLDPVFLHVFTPDEIRAELEAAGFEVAEISRAGHGHAVGRAV